MHGHGDRPNLCIYPGCDRGVLGNGFPRKYNLLDHMKRVHDHQVEFASATEDAVHRKSGNRKRKASTPNSVQEPAPRRQKAVSMLQTSSHGITVPQVGYPLYQQQAVFQPGLPQGNLAQAAQGPLFPSWENQNGFVQSPHEDMHLHQLSQNAGLRRLSGQVSRG